MTTQTYTGCLVDVATGDVVDAGEIAISDSGHMIVIHGERDGRLHSSPYLPNVNRAVLAVPPLSKN